MHLRRALLLFAIVLGLAAIASSISQPRDEPRRRPAEPTRSDRSPSAAPRPERPGIAELNFATGGKPERRRVDAGRPAVVTVKVRSAGQVTLAGLALSAPAEPLTPARFDLVPAEPGRYAVRFDPAGGRGASNVGTIEVLDRR